MDIDQRTRMIGGRSGRIILLGDGTEVMTDSGDQDADMFDQSDEEDKDLENEVQKGQAEAHDRSQREETPAPSGGDSSQTSQQDANESKQRGTGPGSNPEEPKMQAAADGMSQHELKQQFDAQNSK